MMFRITALRRTGFMTGFAVCVFSVLTQAAVLEEIVVTAQKREQNLQDVGISVTAFSAEAIRDLGYTTSVQIAQQTPNLNVIQGYPSNTKLVVRGVSQNDFANHYEAPVATFIDGAYVSATGAIHAQLYDMERVEVLRGPQGTLFGRNATGGVVHYITARPTEELSGYLRATGANLETGTVEGAIGGPLGDTVQARLSGTFYKDGGTVKNRLGPDLRQTDNFGGRLQLAWQPAENFDALVKLHYLKDDPRGNATQHEVVTLNADGLGTPRPGFDYTGYRDTDGDPHAGDYDTRTWWERELYGGSLTLNWSVNDNMTLISISDHLEMDMSSAGDSDSGPHPFLLVGPSVQGFQQTSQELRLEGASDTIRWTLGGYYLAIDTDTLSTYKLDFFPFGATPAYGIGFTGSLQLNTIDTTSWALFAQGEYDLSDTLTAVLGIRYTDDERKLVSTGYDERVTFGGFVAVPGVTADINESLDFENISYRAQLNWKPGAGTLAYFSIAQTHKAGNWALVGSGNDRESPHDEEELRSFELGVKTDLADGRIRFNAAVFHYDYKDYQAFFVEPGATLASFAAVNVINRDAEVLGAEVELSAVPTENIDLVLGFGWLDSEVKDVSLPSGRVTDTELPYAPSVSFNGLARYHWPSAAGKLNAQVDFSYVDNFCFAVMCAPLEQEEGFAIVNFRLKYNLPGERWAVTGWVTNLADEEYRHYGFAGLASLGIGHSVYGNQRMYGVTLDFNF